MKKNRKYNFYVIGLVYAISQVILGLVTTTSLILSNGVNDLSDYLSFFTARKREGAYRHYKRKILTIGHLFVTFFALKNIYTKSYPSYKILVYVNILGPLINLFLVYLVHKSQDEKEQELNIFILEKIANQIVSLVISLVLLIFAGPIWDSSISLFISAIILINIIFRSKDGF